MKKFLLAALAIFGVIFGQMTLAEAYQLENGDQAWHTLSQCTQCGRRGEQLIIYNKATLKNECPDTGCTRNGGGNHYWRMLILVVYQYRNGQWLEINRTYY